MPSVTFYFNVNYFQVASEVDVVVAEGGSREASAAPATAVTVMPTADGEDTADQPPMVSLNSFTFFIRTHLCRHAPFRRYFMSVWSANQRFDYREGDRIQEHVGSTANLPYCRGVCRKM